MARRKPPAPPPEGLLDLFGMQEVPPVRVDTPTPLYGADAAHVKWMKVPAAGGPHSCTLCIRAIHGKPGGKHPLRATARRKGPVEELLLCPEHAQVMRELDQAAEAERKARAKESSERPPARRSSPARHREHA